VAADLRAHPPPGPPPLRRPRAAGASDSLVMRVLGRLALATCYCTISTFLAKQSPPLLSCHLLRMVAELTQELALNCV
jgi:hypothetical protein